MSTSYQDRADHLAALIEERLGIRGAGLQKKLRRAGRLLPKHVHRDAGILLEALHLQSSPKLARRIDDQSIARACNNVEIYLAAIDPSTRRWNRIIGFLSSNAFNILITAALLIGVLIWRGYL